MYGALWNVASCLIYWVIPDQQLYHGLYYAVLEEATSAASIFIHTVANTHVQYLPVTQVQSTQACPYMLWHLSSLYNLISMDSE